MVMPTITEAAREAHVADKSDVVVVGGGPAGISAAVSAARNGASVTLLERYPYLGGLASGGAPRGGALTGRRAGSPGRAFASPRCRAAARRHIGPDRGPVSAGV